MSTVESISITNVELFVDNVKLRSQFISSNNDDNNDNDDIDDSYVDKPAAPFGTVTINVINVFFCLLVNNTN